MRIIEITALDNGAHRNQSGTFGTVPTGWAVIPDNMECENFPFGTVTVEVIDDVPTVITWVPGEIPEPEPEPEVEKEPSANDVLNALLGVNV